MKKHIPNLFTLGNLFCGLLAINEILVHHNMERVAYLVIGGLFFDFLDGMIARLLKVSGELGKQLDSLADMVTFGVVPGLIAYVILQDMNFSYPVLGLMITLFSALRLAKFNIDTRQTDSFIGMPTPANTMLWISVPIILTSNVYWMADFFDHSWVIAILVIVSSFLLTSEVKLLALKFKNFSWHENKIRWVLIILSLLVVFSLAFVYNNIFIPLPFVIFLYLILSVINNRITQSHETI